MVPVSVYLPDCANVQKESNSNNTVIPYFFKRNILGKSKGIKSSYQLNQSDLNSNFTLIMKCEGVRTIRIYYF